MHRLSTIAGLALGPLRVKEDVQDCVCWTRNHHVVGANGELIPVAESSYQVFIALLGYGDFEITAIHAHDTNNRPHEIVGAEFERLSRLAYEDAGVRDAVAEMHE